MVTNPTGGIVGEGSLLNGKVRGQDLTVLGVVEGDLQLEGRLQVGAGGRVTARVRAAEIVVEGEIEGDVRAASLTLGETARARGTFLAKRLVVKEGAVVEGAINPGASEREAVVEAAVTPAASEREAVMEPSVSPAPEAGGPGKSNEKGEGTTPGRPGGLVE